MAFILKIKIKNRNKITLIISLIIITFFSYGHYYDIINNSEILDSEISRHRYLLIPYSGFAIIGIIFFIKSNRLFNNATTITNGISVSIIVLISINIMIDYSNGDFFGSSENTFEEKWLGMSAYNPENKISLEDKNIENNIQQKKNNPDIYYIIPDEYPNNYALKQFFGFDNNEFLEFLNKQEFHIVENSFSNYPTTIQSLTSSLNMEYLNKITKDVDKDSKNYHLLNKLLSDNVVMEKFSSYGYDIVNIGALWGPNGSFKNVKTNLCEFKEVNRDSLSRQLIEKSIIMYFYEKHFEQLKRDQIICTYYEIENTIVEQTTPKLVFVHILSPHAPYIFGPNGENVNPGNSLDSNSWNERNAHVDQIKFVNKNLKHVISKLLDSKNKPIIILQGDTGSGFNIDWEYPSNAMVVERMSNLNAIYFPNQNYDKMNDLTPVNTFKIIFNEYFDEENVLQENKNYWSNSEKPYTFIEITKELKMSK